MAVLTEDATLTVLPDRVVVTALVVEAASSAVLPRGVYTVVPFTCDGLSAPVPPDAETALDPACGV